ncbi:small GTPase [Naegleria gruberi]|uniref:Small GTPase n=1 Tax=Naegleria gruberi TaxID=5762 RepID=D2VXI5_NAEGR|nr:small GTPase [Naegleria gruberi]EFC38515.1 small GTPase [Naegleria gruberi]|eukprot:XP_002671259.1 small GTPase [Naegleria gruberi]
MSSQDHKTMPFCLLNDDMWREIFRFLDIYSLGNLLLTSMNTCPFSRYLLLEDDLWKLRVETKLNALALLVSEPFYAQETSYPTDYLHHPIYENYFHVESNKTNGMPQVELIIREKFREKLVELFHEIDNRVMNEKMDYMEMTKNILVPNFISPYHQKTLFIPKEELKNLENIHQDAAPLTNKLKNISKDLKFNCTMLGLPGSGRTSMIFTLGYGEFPEYIPGVYENFELFYQLEKKKVCLELWDLGCHPGFERLRPHGYTISHLSCVCFSVCSKESLEMAISCYIPEIRLHKGFSTPIILIGCKIDDRELKFSKESLKSLKTPISFEEGEAIARNTGCITYIETSSLKKIGLEDFMPVCVKALAALHSYNDNSEKKKHCQVQ